MHVVGHPVRTGSGMHRYVIAFGVALLALGIALVSPLVDLLPVEALPYLAGTWGSGATHAFRVTTDASDTLNVVAFCLQLVGLAAAVIGWRMRSGEYSR